MTDQAAAVEIQVIRVDVVDIKAYTQRRQRAVHAPKGKDLTYDISSNESYRPKNADLPALEY